MKKLGKFEIIEKVGQGAMGVVYKARDPFIDRIVALKTLTTGLADDANLLKRFYSEARSAGGLQHPNIVTIYELGHEGDTPFIAMQFLNGESLDKIIDRRPNLPLSQKIGFMVYVCRALEYAHKQNPPVVHRDIKPGNVMVTSEGTVMVVDFGIARLGEGTRSQSAGMLIGTLGYMSPQLFRGGVADARSDIWATGVMFYELLAYLRPFQGDNAAALMSNIILEKPRSIIEVAPGTPQDVQAILERMLAKEAEARYQNMEEVLLELEPIWRRLQQAEVANLLVNSQQLFEAGDLENAKAKVSQIIQIDTSNTQAKSLLEKINAEVRRKQVVPQLKARVENAGRLLANGQVEDAKAEVEAALKLDSTYQPARELLGQAQAALERARNITQALRTSKQRMAEGALTEAELQLDKVLEIDPGNAAAREQLKQIREERSRRERRKQRDEALHRARTFWTNLQYEECINLLLTAQKQFPGDSEITKLLESARQDQAEQQRQSLLTEARNFLSAQRFEDSLRALDLLLERYPSDATAKNLRTHALQGRDQQRRDQRLGEGKSKLRAWVKEGKYTEAITHAAQLSKEFPDDFELAELLDFARTEQSQLEQKRHLDQFTKQIQQALKDNRFSEAVQTAEKALLEFPKNLDLLILLDRAKKEQSEKEKHELLKQRLREVERLMDRQELTDAIDLARQTLATVGQDSRIADTLLKAEREFEFREQRKRQQNDTVQKARTLLDAGKFADSTSILKDAIGTQLLPENDPRLVQLLNEIDARKGPPPPAAAAAAAAVAAPSATIFGSPIGSTPAADPGKDYVYQRGAPLPEELVSPERDTFASAFSPTIVTGPSAQPAPPPAPPAVTPVPQKTEKKKRRPEPSPLAEAASATQVIPLVPGPGEAASQLFARAEEPAFVPTAPPSPIWKRPLPMAMAGLALVAVLTAGVYVIVKPSRPTLPSNPPTETTPPTSSVKVAPSTSSEPATPTAPATPAPKTSPGKQPENAVVLVQGMVTDPTGAVPKANVRITSTAGSDRYAITDGKGHYEIKGVQPGNYKVLVNAESHTAVELNVAVPNASAKQIDIPMGPATTAKPTIAARPLAPEPRANAEAEKAPNLEANNPAPDSGTTIATAPPPAPVPVKPTVSAGMLVEVSLNTCAVEGQGGLGDVKQGATVDCSGLQTPLSWGGAQLTSNQSLTPARYTLRCIVEVDGSVNSQSFRNVGQPTPPELLALLSAESKKWKMTKPVSRGLTVKARESMTIVVKSP